jgi:hypothetical protein
MIAWWWIPVGIVGVVVLAFLLLLVAMWHELRRYIRIKEM